MSAVSANIASIKAEIAKACQSCGRKQSDVSLVAVSKTKPLSQMIEAYDAGQRVFGENYVQELEEKNRQLKERDSSVGNDFEFHLIGPLQSNKVNRVVGLCSLIHSVDRLKIADAISRSAESKNLKQDVLLQINISKQSSKSGVMPEQASAFLAHCLSLTGIRVLGLMSIGSSIDVEPKVSEIEREFAEMFELRNKLSLEFALELPHLSMGMSGDFPLAIKHGSTLVRVGSAIFGEREYGES